MKLIVSIALLALLSGCSVAFYGRIGSQELRDVEFRMESQKADPNLPAGFIGTLAEILEVL